MSEAKVQAAAQVDEAIEEPGNGSQAVIVGSEQLKNYEAYQHSLTRTQAFKEEWKPIMWCTSSLHLFDFDYR